MSPVAKSPKALPQLPLEIWIRILATVSKKEQLGRLWLNARRVSRVFKAATEAAFVQQHLRIATIHYNLGWEWTEEGKYQLGTQCEFDRLSDDGDTAFFRDRRGLDEFAEATVYRETLSRWRERIAMYVGDGSLDRRYDLPPHIIVLRSLVMDTELPGLQVDFEVREISFFWKKALSLFFGELEYIRAIEDLEFCEKRDQINDMRNMLNRGEVSIFSVLMNGLTMIENVSEKVAKRVRRLRFRRWYKKHGSPLPKDWFEEDYDEREKLRELREMKQGVEWAELDDNDDEDNEEKGKRKKTALQEREREREHEYREPCELTSDRAALGLDLEAFYAEDEDGDGVRTATGVDARDNDNGDKLEDSDSDLLDEIAPAIGPPHVNQ